MAEMAPTKGLLGPGPNPGSGGVRQGVAPEVDYQGEANVTPEEQAQYDQFMDNAFNVMYDEKVLPTIVERMKQAKAGGNPIEGLATAAVQVVRRLVDSARNQGREIDPSILLHGGSDILGDLAMVAEKAGIHQFSEDEIENALYVAMDLYGSMELEAGTLNKEGIAEDFKTLMQANEQGTLDELVPGIGDYAQKIQGGQKGGGNAGA